VQEGSLGADTDAGGNRQDQSGGHALPAEGPVDADRTDLRGWSGSRLAAVNWTRSPRSRPSSCRDPRSPGTIGRDLEGQQRPAP
jgi:hypothetical protein